MICSAVLAYLMIKELDQKGNEKKKKGLIVLIQKLHILYFMQWLAKVLGVMGVNPISTFPQGPGTFGLVGKS